MEKHSLGARRQGQSRGGRVSGAAFIASAALFVVGAAATSHATPYWIAWEGDDWPENQGWTRDILGGGDVRTLENGVMTLDGLDTGPGFVWDAYEWFRPGSMDPGPGETFVMQWRLRVNAVTNGNWDPLVFIYADDFWGVHLDFSVNRLWSSHEGAAQVQFAPGVFHDYEMRSSDMRGYELFIDGVLMRTGNFTPSIPPGSWIGWGDGASVERSRSDWDYVRFGVVPEGTCSSAMLIVAFIATRVRRGS